MLSSTYITAVSTKERLEGPPADFVFTCKDGEVKAHKWVLWRASGLIRGMLDFDMKMESINVNYTQDVMEQAMTWIYGLYLGNKTAPLPDQKPIPICIKLYSVFQFLMVDGLLDSCHYITQVGIPQIPKRNALALGAMSNYDSSVMDQVHAIPNIEEVDKVIEWLLTPNELSQKLQTDCIDHCVKLIAVFMVGMAQIHPDEYTQDSIFSRCLKRCSELTPEIIAQLCEVTIKLHLEHICGDDRTHNIDWYLYYFMAKWLDDRAPTIDEKCAKSVHLMLSKVSVFNLFNMDEFTSPCFKNLRKMLGEKHSAKDLILYDMRNLTWNYAGMMFEVVGATKKNLKIDVYHGSNIDSFTVEGEDMKLVIKIYVDEVDTDPDYETYEFKTTAVWDRFEALCDEYRESNSV